MEKLKQQAERQGQLKQTKKVAIRPKSRGEPDLESAHKPVSTSSPGSGQGRISKEEQSGSKQSRPMSLEEMLAFKVTHDSLNYTTIDVAPRCESIAVVL
jgi:hypothetical protein